MEPRTAHATEPAAAEPAATEPAAAQVRFNVLGPLEGWYGEERLRLGGAIQERVLVALLLEAGRVIPVSRLVAAAWDEEPPATAFHQIRKAVADLRKRIPAGSRTLMTDGPGYRAVVGPAQLDLSEFDARTKAAKEAARQDRSVEAVGLLGSALALWRGPVLSGQGGQVIEAATVALEERRLAAYEQSFELRLSLGEGSDLVSSLRELVELHPMRETLRGQLMRALYRTGRQADALEEYRTVRTLLADELGVDPGPQLSKVYEDILRESPELLPPGPQTSPQGARPEPPPAAKPRDLPCDLPDFTGREGELRQLTGWVRAADDGACPRATTIVAIDGMGGSGKTALAVRAAHLLAAGFPDGQVHVDLRGYTPGEQPVPAMTALGRLLRAMGVPGERLPDDLPGRTALWRATLEGRRVLLLLDNAVDVKDVVPLLPDSPGCLTLVTSRVRLVDLDGAAWLSLGMMARQDSAALVANTVGAERVAAEPEAAEELARLCGYLPLALRIATAKFRKRPRWTVRYLVDRLRDETRRMEELSLGERSVAATLRLSYQVLDERCRIAFRRLALHPGEEIDTYSAGALLGTEAQEAEDILETLLDAHLLQQPDIGVYSLHDLVRSFARGLNEAAEGQDEAAVVHLLDYYLGSTELACGLRFPGWRYRSTGLDRPVAELPPMACAEEAEDWFRREHNTLFAAISLALARGHDRHAVWLVRNLSFRLNAHGYLEEFAELGRLSVAAARRLGDLMLVGLSLTNLSVACWKLGKLTEGVKVAEEGWKVARELGDRRTEAHSESVLGQYHSLLGRFPTALKWLERAVAAERELESPRDEAECLTLLSALYERWGRYEEAVDAASRALDLARRFGHGEIEWVALTDLALALIGLEEFHEADRWLAAARARCSEHHEPGQAAITLTLSALTAHHLGDRAGEAAYAEQARPSIDATVSPLRTAKAENLLGRLLSRQGRHEAALDAHTAAYEIAAPLKYRVVEAYALLGMADAALVLGDAETAGRHRRTAEEWFAAVGVEPGRRRG
ncbi:AfsR/SARP family transcriptional regulator [Streptomyces sp. KLOTTS4A1]|uniref:AfsR/SARP family transcriptional regulator n=1 Tax=Streptomyces sp. KLOTTS4A1 TaxID=3390996 RepID=UPI0039F5034E